MNATPKQTLLAHFAERHPHAYKPKSMTLAQLQAFHRLVHHRYATDHVHAGANLGAGDRPEGWTTGGDVVMKRATI